MKQQPTETPCIGICSTIYGDEVCRGCLRTYTEVIDWNAFTDEQKLDTLNRIAEQITTKLNPILSIEHPRLLEARCNQHNIKYRPNQNPLCWAYAILKEGADKMHDLKKYGILITQSYQNQTPAQLIEYIDDLLHQHAMEEAGFNA